MTQLLQDKNVIIYGAGGGIGRGVARTFAQEGARVFLAGRTLKTLEAVAEDVRAAGGVADVAEVDALDERAVDEHAQAVVSAAGGIDVSFNLITRGDVQGIPLVDMSGSDLTRAVTNGLLSNFYTARAAARHMAPRGSGVILTVTSGSSRGAAPGMGSTGPADAAVETFLRYLAAEVGPSGVRVVGIHTAGVVETMTRDKVVEVNEGMTDFDPAAFEQMMASMTMLKRAPRLAMVADTAAFLASDRAAGITGTIVNVTCGLIAG
ncbi:SDR family NAD(P)-dependent oxidoreductase [Sphaerisporangium album]|uniref:SDR family NAD(P)-dependent oxidoreductase n=1 Tax=Sphaerisporangium album TaxID=509200 RepID=A0A367FHE1_9ACTN|nr:SDR family oxidoreductase [Sphaerisporangium album]RCG29065.1 SDR family NAD(P)-dependent oxidoreductase [Sphaerisporangium album]